MRKEAMSASRNILCLLDENSKTFIKRFAFYLDAADEVITLQGQMGLGIKEMAALPENDQNIIKSYLFLVESGNTTWAASLRLLSTGFFSDAYGLIRILYETAAILHYGNSCPSNTRTELHRAMFQSGLGENEHRKQEWKFTQKATRLFEKDNPGLVPVRQELNNFGGHISRSKVVLGNVTTVGNKSASRLFTPNWSDRKYLSGLEFLFWTTALILDEYVRLQESYGGISPEVKGRVKRLSGTFLSSVRPRLQAMMETNET
jgi:hypothetical protein